MKNRLRVLALVLVLGTGPAGCDKPIEQTARDTIAASSVVVKHYQGIYRPSCEKDPDQGVCNAINAAADAVNLAIESLEVYCAGPDFNAGGPCQPSAGQAGATARFKLEAALDHLGRVVAHAKSLAETAAGKSPGGASRW